MKKAKKAMLLVLCAALLVTVSVMGTLAYLTSSDSVENTFTVGQVSITLEETLVDEYGDVLTGNAAGTTEEGNEYKLIPGHTYTKDPTITVGSESEKCWLFVKVENGLGTDATIKWKTGWSQITGTDYWAYDTVVEANGTETAFESFTFATDADPADYEDAAILVTAYAIQADGITTSELAWTALKGQLNLS